MRKAMDPAPLVARQDLLAPPTSASDKFIFSGGNHRGIGGHSERLRKQPVCGWPSIARAERATKDEESPAPRHRCVRGNHMPWPCWRSSALVALSRTECRGLTRRSRRGPTARRQARATGTVYIFRGPGLASYRRPRLTSNVRPQRSDLLARHPCETNTIT